MQPKPSSLPAAPARLNRQPTRALYAGLLLVVFMLVVWFGAPDLRLPTFFQRLVAAVNALLAMLVVVFAIREYGKKYQRLRWPLLGRVSTSKVAGTVTMLAVFAWWLSPWAPIPAGEMQPDLWRMLERDLDVAQVVLLDADRAAIAPPAPSPAAAAIAEAIGPGDPPFRRALRATVGGRAADATELLDQALRSGAIDANVRDMAVAQAEMYAGQFAAASDHYGDLLKRQPRREFLLAHGTLAAALAGDLIVANDRATQLLDQARTRHRDNTRFRQAINFVVAVRVLQGRLPEAEHTSQETRPARERIARDEPLRRIADDPQLAIDVNNAAVLRVLRGSAGDARIAESLLLARTLWSQCNEPHLGASSAALQLAVVNHNLGMVSLQDSQFVAAETLLAAAAAPWRRRPAPTARKCSPRIAPPWPAVIG